MSKSINFFTLLSSEVRYSKKVLIVCTILIGLMMAPSAAYSQVSIGLYGGATFTKFSGTIPGGLVYDYKTGYEAGITTSIKLFNDAFLSIRPGFIQNGTSVTGDQEASADASYDSTMFYDITTKSFQLPTFFLIRVSKGFYGIGGINNNYIFSAESETDGTNTDVLEYFTPWQFQGVFGFGFGFNTKRVNGNLELTYSQGLNTLTQQKYIDDGSVPRIRNQGFKATLIVIIGLSKKKQEEL